MAADPTLMTTKDWFEIAEHGATVLALLVGGTWVLYQYVIRRSGETGLSIDVTSQATPAPGDRRFVFVDVTVKNTGQTRLDASCQSRADFIAGYEGSLQCAGSLQIRRMTAPAGGKVAHLDWWSEDPALRGDLIVPEIEILTEYTDAQGKVEFFMEPGEEYRLGSFLVLEPGTYLAKVVFVGNRRHEYWSRIVPLIVT